LRESTGLPVIVVGGGQLRNVEDYLYMLMVFRRKEDNVRYTLKERLNKSPL
jgi:hypothetical protein